MRLTPIFMILVFASCRREKVKVLWDEWHGVEYFQNGNKSNEFNLLSDSLGKWTVDGKWNEWFDNGKPKFQALLRNNWTVNKWQEWDSAGNIKEGEKPVNITF